MTDVFDVAAYILHKQGAMTTMKLQKLVYYSQAWSTVWDDDVIFEEPIEAWKRGPVVRALFNETKGQFRVSQIGRGDRKNLNKDQKETVDLILKFYGKHDAQWLSDLTHLEDPWRDAYEQGQDTEITPNALVEYYSTIEPNEQARG